MNESTNIKLTPKQIENWRKVLAIQIGSAAWTMSDEEIQQQRDAMQQHANNMDFDPYENDPTHGEA